MTLEMLIGASVAAATLRLAAPIALAALGGVVTERSGVTNIALEASMLVGAFFGVVAADRTRNIWIALGIALLAGVLLALLHAYASITLRSDQIVSGMALNILALGLTTYLDYQMYGTTGTPADLPGLPDVQLGFLNGVPYIGEAVGSQNSTVWVMGLLVIGLQVFLF
nr:ABC transporter permease [Chloroflexota bacterium]